MSRTRDPSDSAAQAHGFSADVLMETLPDAVVVADGTTGEIVTVNDAAEELFDCPATELIGRDQSTLHPAEDADLYREAFRRGVQNERVDRLQDGSPVYIETKTGERKPVEINVQRVQQDGQPFVVGVFREISTQLRRKQELEQTTTRLNALLDSAPLPVAVLDTDGRVELWNQAAEDVFGYAAAEIIGDRYPLFTDQAQFDELFEAVLVGRTIEGVRIPLRARNGSRITAEIYASPLYEDGEVTGVIGSAVSVMDKQQREQHLDVVHRLLRHNLRNKLTVIDSYGSMLATGDTRDQSTVQQAGKSIVTAANELSELSDHALRTRQEVTAEETASCEMTALVDSIEEITPASVAKTVTSNADTTIDEVVIPQQAANAVSRLVTRIVEYTPHDNLQFTVELCPQYVLIRVTNQTALLPDGDAMLLTEGTETALAHGQTMEVARAYLTLVSVGGDIVVTGDKAARDAFRIELPRRDSQDN